MDFPGVLGVLLPPFRRRYQVPELLAQLDLAGREPRELANLRRHARSQPARYHVRVVRVRQVLAMMGSARSACSAPSLVEPAPAAAMSACAELLQAEPADWSRCLPAVLRLGPAGAPALADALRRQPDAPGAQAATAVLGQLGGPAAHDTLVELLRGPIELATEAALALGAHAQAGDRALLLELANDRLRDPTLRAACVHSLLRLGSRAELRPLVRAFVLADTPAGRVAQQQVGLPAKSRWAHERYLISSALRHTAGAVLAFDTDASWPQLEAAAARIDAWLEANS